MILSERTCAPPSVPASSEKDVCLSPHKYGDTCTFRCEAGYHLPPDALSATQCTVGILPGGATPLMQWDVQPEPCIGRVLFCRFLVCNQMSVLRCLVVFHVCTPNSNLSSRSSCNDRRRCFFSAHVLNASHVIQIHESHVNHIFIVHCYDTNYSESYNITRRI